MKRRSVWVPPARVSWRPWRGIGLILPTWWPNAEASPRPALTRASTRFARLDEVLGQYTLRGKRSPRVRPWILRKCLFSLLPRHSVGTDFWADMTDGPGRHGAIVRVASRRGSQARDMHLRAQPQGRAAHDFACGMLLAPSSCRVAGHGEAFQDHTRRCCWARCSKSLWQGKPWFRHCLRRRSTSRTQLLKRPPRAKVGQAAAAAATAASSSPDKRWRGQAKPRDGDGEHKGEGEDESRPGGARKER